MDQNFLKQYIKQTMINESNKEIPTTEQIKDMDGLDKWYAVMQNVSGITDLEYHNGVISFLFRDTGYQIKDAELALSDAKFALTCNTMGSLASMEALKAYEKDIIWLLRRMKAVVDMLAIDELDFVVHVDRGDFCITVDVE